MTEKEDHGKKQNAPREDAMPGNVGMASLQEFELLRQY